MVSGTTTLKKWHIGNWTGLGWPETGIKLAADGVAFIALLYMVGGADFRFWGGVYDLRVIILALMALGLTFAIADRYLEKEIIATLFVISNVIAHWGMVYALWRQPGSNLLSLINYQPQNLLPWQLLPIFAALMLIGDLVKIVFLRRTKFTVRGYDQHVLVYLTGSFVVGYALILILSLYNPYIG